MGGNENNRDAGASAHPAKSDADASDQVSQEGQKKGTILTETIRGSRVGRAMPRHQAGPRVARRPKRFLEPVQLSQSIRRTPRHQRAVASPEHT